MTREETIKQLENLKCHCEEFLKETKSDIWRKDVEAIFMAIKALEQEPKTDILDKIRAEIAEEKIGHDLDIGNETLYNNAIDDCLKIIDKYRQGEEK